MNLSRLRAIGFLLGILLAFLDPLASHINPLSPLSAHANGFIDFEDGVDGQAIRSTIPGLEFITTDGQDWIYGDWRTGNYNGKYPNGQYTSNGNFFAWLGPNQGDGRINFTLGDATYLSIRISTYDIVTLRGYAEDGTVLDTATFSGGNIGTGDIAELRIETTSALRFAYAIVSGNANYWLLDDLATDAAGVPNTKIPLIFIPGILGTSLDNTNGEVWPNGTELITDQDDDSMLVLRLADDGESPLEPENENYNSVSVGEVLSSVAGQDVYQSTFTFLGKRDYSTQNQTLYLFGYDWRKDNRLAADQLAELIQQVKEDNGVDKVNILAHSMGGLVARLYISDPTRAANVDTLVTLGTPYLGAPKAFNIVHYGNECMLPAWFGKCWLNRTTTHDIAQNMPGVYQLLPNPNYHKVYPDGHLQMDRDTDGDGVNEGWLDFSAVQKIIEDDHSAAAFAKALAIFDAVGSYAGGTNNVKVYAFVGMREGTPGTVREYMKPAWFGFSEKVEYDFVTINGDGTVPLHSGDLGRNDREHDFSGSVSYFYANAEHGALAKYEGAGEAVLELAADILEAEAPSFAARSTPSAGASNMLYAPGAAADASAVPAYAAAVAAAKFVSVTLEPEPLAGYQFLVYGASLLEVTDAAGNVTQVTTDDVLESQIPGSGIHQLGSTTSIFVPAGAQYQVRALGQADDVADMRIRVIADDVITETIVYKDIPVQPGAVAVLDYDPAAVDAPLLMVDEDGDGQTDYTRDPDTILAGATVNDVTAPVSEINITYSPTSTLATVSLQGIDEALGSGVLRVEYSLDGGESTLPYVGPFDVDWMAHRQLLVKTIDRAGNEEYPLSTATLSGRLYLPTIKAQ